MRALTVYKIPSKFLACVGQRRKPKAAGVILRLSLKVRELVLLEEGYIETCVGEQRK